MLTGNSGSSTGKIRDSGTAISAVVALYQSCDCRVPQPKVFLGASGLRSLQQQAPLSTYISSLGTDRGPVNPVQGVNLGLKVPSWHPCHQFSLLKKGLNIWASWQKVISTFSSSTTLQWSLRNKKARVLGRHFRPDVWLRKEVFRRWRGKVGRSRRDHFKVLQVRPCQQSLKSVCLLQAYERRVRP